MAGPISKNFDIERPETTIATINGFEEGSVPAVAIRKLFPDATTTEDLATEVENMLYNYDTKGVAESINSGLPQSWTAEDLMKPGAAAVVQRIYEVNNEVFRNLESLF